MWQGCFDKELIINEYQIKPLFILKKTCFFRTSFLLYYKHISRAQNLFYKNRHWKSIFYVVLMKFLCQKIKYLRANRNERCKMCLCIYNFSVDTQRPSCLFWEKRIRKISELIFLSSGIFFLWILFKFHFWKPKI